jgi:hypothetical protein
VPAARSRTERWRECLQQIYERHGALEVTLPRHIGKVDGAAGGGTGQNLLWRVRVLGMTDDEIVVEQPSAMGHTIPLQANIELIAVMTIGQNRWMFHTRTLGHTDFQLRPGRRSTALRIAMPEKVERCQRRAFFRISTAALALPGAQCWPVLDQTSLLAAEAANRAVIVDASDADVTGRPAPDPEEFGLLPEVGPMFSASVLNVSGGGVGLLVGRSEGGSLERARTFWIRINLEPQIPVPLGVAARLAHQRIDSRQDIYAGYAFEFSHNPAHQTFIVEQICRYVALIQRQQLEISTDR